MRSKPKGWPGERKRHSEAATKGWQKRREEARLPYRARWRDPEQDAADDREDERLETEKLEKLTGYQELQAAITLLNPRQIRGDQEQVADALRQALRHMERGENARAAATLKKVLPSVHGDNAVRINRVLYAMTPLPSSWTRMATSMRNPR